MADNTNVFFGHAYDPTRPDVKKGVRGFLYPEPGGLHNIHVLVYQNTGTKTPKTAVQSFWLKEGAARFLSLRVLGDSLVGYTRNDGILAETVDVEFVFLK